MRLILVRHAEAGPGQPDELRSLTPAGREAARALAARLADESPDVVLSSPLLRARETAMPIAEAVGVTPETDDRLAPGASVDDVREVIAGRGETVVVIAHQPDCSEIALALTGRQVRFPPAAASKPSCEPAHHDPSRMPSRVHERCVPRQAKAGATMSAVRVRGLRKSYGDHEAVCGIDFDIPAGEVFGLLGPNGAGKTTTVEILEGYRNRDGGEVEVLGEDPQRAGNAWRERLGVVLQSSSLYPNLTVRESLALFAGYYRQSRDVDEVVEIVGLEEKADARARTLSGGQKRRLDLGLALIGDPELIFLDEPTTGFDPAARRQAWETIRNLRALGTTVLLTTHYLDEAEQLADRVAVIVAGEIIREGSPAELTSASPETEIRYRRNGEEILERTTNATQRLHELTAEALERGEELEGLEVRRPTLEDVYLELTAE